MENELQSLICFSNNNPLQPLKFNQLMQNLNSIFAKHINNQKIGFVGINKKFCIQVVVNLCNKVLSGVYIQQNFSICQNDSEIAEELLMNVLKIMTVADNNFVDQKFVVKTDNDVLIMSLCLLFCKIWLKGYNLDQLYFINISNCSF